MPTAHRPKGILRREDGFSFAALWHGAFERRGWRWAEAPRVAKDRAGGAVGVPVGTADDLAVKLQRAMESALAPDTPSREEKPGAAEQLAER